MRKPKRKHTRKSVAKPKQEPIVYTMHLDVRQAMKAAAKFRKTLHALHLDLNRFRNSLRKIFK